jgi:hypothetical protein
VHDADAGARGDPKRAEAEPTRTASIAARASGRASTAGRLRIGRSVAGERCRGAATMLPTLRIGARHQLSCWSTKYAYGTMNYPVDYPMITKKDRFVQ